MTIASVVGLLNIMAGLMLVAAFLFFFSGSVAYLARIGLQGREEGLHYMMWGVTILFVLTVILGLVKYIQFHTDTVVWIVSIAVIIFGGYALITSLQAASAASHDE